MKLKISQILEGIRNHLLPPKELKAIIDSVSKERQGKCIECAFNSTPGMIAPSSTCKCCGCFLVLKTKSLSSNCGIEEYNQLNPYAPLALKWHAVASDEQENEILKKLKEDES